MSSSPMDESRAGLAVIGWVLAACIFWAGVGVGLLAAGCAA